MEEDRKRSAKRVPFRNPIHFGPTPFRRSEHTGFVVDLSSGGVCIQTSKVFGQGTRLYMLIEATDKSYEAEGVVTWAKKVPPRLIQHIKNGMGVKFTYVNKELLDRYADRLKIVT